jgi:hypothetical protein
MAKMTLDNLDLRELETGFHYLWQEFSTYGLTGQANLLAKFYREDEATPDRNLFIAWGLVCRFYRPGIAPGDAWKEAVTYLKDSQQT